MNFGKGFDAFREKSKYNKYCDYFYQAMGDSEDLCQNPNVLEYDLVHSERATYCLHWKPVTPKAGSQKTTFKSGVNIGGHKKTLKSTRKKSR